MSWVDEADVGWTGPSQPTSASSPIASRSFCADCGTPITLQYTSASHEVAFYAGTFDTPEQTPPTYNYHEESRLTWAQCGN
nr:GFA family protein [Phyllobacterium sp. IY22]